MVLLSTEPCALPDNTMAICPTWVSRFFTTALWFRYLVSWHQEYDHNIVRWSSDRTATPSSWPGDCGVKAWDPVALLSITRKPLCVEFRRVYKTGQEFDEGKLWWPSDRVATRGQWTGNHWSKHETLGPHLASQENLVGRVTKFAWPDQELVRARLGDQVIKWRCMAVWLGDGRVNPLDLCVSLGITRNSCGSSFYKISRLDQEFNRNFLRLLKD